MPDPGPEKNSRHGTRPVVGVNRFDFAGLIEDGFAWFAPGTADLLVAFRGTGMIDVFDCRSRQPVAFLDFDLARAIHLDSAFVSPFIGLPFSAALKRAHSACLENTAALRQRHHYGFHVEAPYRNRGAKGIWNLDELMMAVALAYAENIGLAWFEVRPTGDTAPYYVRKYAAVRRPTSAAETVLSIPLGTARKPLPHVRCIREAGRIHRLDVETAAGVAWTDEMRAWSG